jgi:hypothetical protein
MENKNLKQIEDLLIDSIRNYKRISILEAVNEYNQIVNSEEFYINSDDEVIYIINNKEIKEKDFLLGKLQQIKGSIK